MLPYSVQYSFTVSYKKEVGSMHQNFLVVFSTKKGSEVLQFGK